MTSITLIHWIVQVILKFVLKTKSYEKVLCLNFRAFHRTKKLITIDTNWLSLVKKNTGILIVNGRVGNDTNMRKCTCKNVSVIDYAIASPSFFPDFCHFDVLPFNDTFSYIHCPIHVKIGRNNSKSVEVGINTHDNSGKQIKSNWKQKFVFSSNIDSSRFYELRQLIELLQTTDSVTQENTDFFCGEIKEVLLYSAFAFGALGIKSNNSKRKPRKRSKPWWNDGCVINRKKFNHARKKYANDSSKENGSLKNSSSKAYKRSINKAMNKFDKDLHQKLRSLQRKNPKEYWQIINHADGSILALSKLNCEIFAKHFKDLNTNKNSDEPFDIDSIPITEDSPLNILFYQKMNYYRLLGKMAKYAASMWCQWGYGMFF